MSVRGGDIMRDFSSWLSDSSASEPVQGEKGRTWESTAKLLSSQYLGNKNVRDKV